jgi:hypothetical protein
VQRTIESTPQLRSLSSGFRPNRIPHHTEAGDFGFDDIPVFQELGRLARKADCRGPPYLTAAEVEPASSMAYSPRMAC